MRPYNLTDQQLSTLINAMRQHGVYMTKSLLNTVKGIIYRMVCGVPWRDLPPHFGNWNSIYSCFRRWSRKKVIAKVFKSIVRSISKEQDKTNSTIKKVYLDGTFVKAHQHSAVRLKNKNVPLENQEVVGTQKYIC